MSASKWRLPRPFQWLRGTGSILLRPSIRGMSGKRQTPPRSALSLTSGACGLPHPQKRATGGEDAWFISGNTVGVADGVGGWARKGIDSGEYSRTLMKSAKRTVSAADKVPTPLQVLKVAHRHVQPEMGDEYELETQEGDVIVLGTDGLFDNLFPDQITRLLDTVLPSTPDFDAYSMEKVASCIAHTAHNAAKGVVTTTPFAVAAQQAGFEYLGGKMDDITVVTSLVASGDCCDIDDVGTTFKQQ
ncbi:hypothetical protein PsorP6_014374 [Peronosclerospora sorghi]|uniref:Uncharacterized protein n=1 Tax=Peronosclerospora sorghi TaxID=230839 RepID=A0ACC0VH50_9STRA|nr:hypothetical protein PsorP6_014374 [Peronosclerospora sorghi]